MILLTVCTGHKQILNSLRQSFPSEFELDQLEIERCGKEVREEIQLAKAQEDREYQDLQQKQIEFAKKGRIEQLFHSKLSLRKLEELEAKQDQLQLRKSHTSRGGIRKSL